MFPSACSWILGLSMNLTPHPSLSHPMGRGVAKPGDGDWVSADGGCHAGSLLVYRGLTRLRSWLIRRFTPAGGFVAGRVSHDRLTGLGFPGDLGSPGLRGPVRPVAASLWPFGPFFRIAVAFSAGCRGLPRWASPSISRRPAQPSVPVERGLDYLEDVAGDGLSYDAFIERVRPGRRSRTFRLSAPLPPAQAAVARVCAVPPLPAGAA